MGRVWDPVPSRVVGASDLQTPIPPHIWECPPPSASEPRFQDASIVTPRNAVNDVLGKHRLLQLAQRLKVRAVSHHAVDYLAPSQGRAKAPLPPNLARVAANVTDKVGKCPKDFTFVPTAPVAFMGTDTTLKMPEIGLATGSEGTLVRIELDEREPPDPDPSNTAECWVLQYPPSCVVVRMDQFKHKTLEGLGLGEISFRCVPGRFDITPKQVGAVRHLKSVPVLREKNPPLLQLIANTDYSIQGATKPAIIADFTPAPLTANRLQYPRRDQLLIPPSRVGTMNGFALLRAFELDVITKTFLEPDLFVERVRWNRLNREYHAEHADHVDALRGEPTAAAADPDADGAEFGAEDDQ